MSNRRKRRPGQKQHQTAGARQPVYQRPTGRPAGEPIQAGRPPVTSVMTYVVQPVFDANAPRPQIGDRGPKGSPGAYRVRCPLAVPGRNVVQDRLDFEELVRHGDSLLAVAADVRNLNASVVDAANGSTIDVTVHVNADHRLRDLEFEIEADDFTSAAERGHDLVSALLSRWAFLHDVPMTTSGMEIVEMATQTHAWTMTWVGMVKAFADTEGVTDADHRVLLSAYREALGSTEPMWQALCLYKVAEGVWAFRQQRTQAAIAAGATPAEPNERVPTDLSEIGHPNERAVLEGALRPYAGKRFRAAFDDIRETVRHAVAHLDPNGNPLVQDRWQDLQKVQTTLPGLGWMARQMLDAEVQAHPEPGPMTAP